MKEIGWQIVNLSLFGVGGALIIYSVWRFFR